MPTKTHERAAVCFESLIRTLLERYLVGVPGLITQGQFKFHNWFTLTRSATFIWRNHDGTEVRKEPDESFYPCGRSRKIRRWPCVTFESGLSETLPELIRDVDEWLSLSVVTAVFTIKVYRETKKGVFRLHVRRGRDEAVLGPMNEDETAFSKVRWSFSFESETSDQDCASAVSTLVMKVKDFFLSGDALAKAQQQYPGLKIESEVPDQLSGHLDQELVVKTEDIVDFVMQMKDALKSMSEDEEDDASSSFSDVRVPKRSRSEEELQEARERARA
ncbi:hypothetical protein PQX77_012844 [Marasmius sp. AFHP31]|nr:hypothetical protein PQX77_012844 [Marasmius sp. AFHP31]